MPSEPIMHTIRIADMSITWDIWHLESYKIYEPPIAEDHVIQNFIEVTLKRWPEQKSDTGYDGYIIKCEL